MARDSLEERISVKSGDRPSHVPTDGRTTPVVSVIIPTRDRPHQLARCLESLLLQEQPGGPFEVIVVDDGSQPPCTPAVAAYQTQLDLTLLQQRQAGPAVARNLGLTAANAPLAAFLDDDCLADRRWLAELAAAHRSNPEVLLGGTVHNGLPHDPYASASHLILGMVYRHFNHGPDGLTFFTTNNMAASTRRLREMGGFDAGFRIAAAEDRDLCRRWRACGGTLSAAPHAIVEHFHASNLREFCSVHFRYGRGACLLRQRPLPTRPALAGDRGFHRQLPGLLKGAVSRAPHDIRLRLLAALLVWKFAELAGFAFQSLTPPPVADSSHAAQD
jgi:glycosyltransferase involved in cell wall biosynthesis